LAPHQQLSTLLLRGVVVAAVHTEDMAVAAVVADSVQLQDWR
jgi:hypothetical protein